MVMVYVIHFTFRDLLHMILIFYQYFTVSVLKQRDTYIPLGRFNEFNPRKARFEKVFVCAELFFTPGW